MLAIFDAARVPPRGPRVGMAALRKRAAVALLALPLSVAMPDVGHATVRCGDCDADGVVRIDELVGAVNNALSAQPGRGQSFISPFQTIPPGYIVQTAPTEYTVRRAIVDFAVANLGPIATQFRFIPHFEDGQITAYRPIDISPLSLLDQLGFASLDLIDSVNGTAVGTEGLDIAALLAADEVVVRIRRDQQGLVLRFSIVP